MADLEVDDTELHATASTMAVDPGLPQVEVDTHLLGQQRQHLLENMFGIHSDPVRRIGGYVIHRELGRGGMGVVYLGYDIELDRKVAIKTLQVDDPMLRRRFMREARAMARLSHPNIVQIHEVGVREGSVFIAMEFIEGQTLKQWAQNQEQPRPWRELLAVMIQAGRGLEAAHEANLAHRDFKPDNVIVGVDGRVRVVDFGLVRAVESDERPVDLSFVETEDDSDSMSQLTRGHAMVTAATAPLDERSGDDVLGEQLTRQGTVLGTPMYMAPEQHAGLVSGPLADQFAFCVTAFELLVGVRPFEGQTMAALADTKRSGTRVKSPAERKLPRALMESILRGMAARSVDRFDDMSTLVTALERALDARRRRSIFTVVGLGALSILAGLSTVLASSYAEPDAAAMCMLDEQALALPWREPSREALRAALSTQNPDFDPRSFAAIDREMSDWTTRWVESQRRSCEATRIVGSQSEALMDLRGSCLERQRREVVAIARVLTQPESAGIAHAFELLDELPDIERCEDPNLAAEPYPLPTSDKTRREAILATFEELSEGRALMLTDRFDEADELAEQLQATIGALDHLPLTLEHRSLIAELTFRRKRYPKAVELQRAVIREAEIAGLDEISATASTRLAHELVGRWEHRDVQALVLDQAEIAVARVGRPNDPRELTLDVARASLLESRGQHEAALAGYREAADNAEERGELSRGADAQRQVALLLVRLGRFEDAERAFARARSLWTEARGPGTLVDADIEYHLGLLELARGSLDAAAARFDTARALYTPLLDDDAYNFADLALAEGKLAVLRGQFETARQRFTRVVELTNNDLLRAEAWEALGVIAFYEDELATSLDAYRHARHDYLAAYGPAHPSVGVLISNIGESLAASGDHASALEAYADALSILEAALPPDHPDLALPYKGRAQSRLALGDRSGARQDLERALSLRRQNPGEPVEHADVEFTLARVLFDDGETVRALSLARQARQRLLDLGHHSLGSTISDWLQQHDHSNNRTNRNHGK